MQIIIPIHVYLYAQIRSHIHQAPTQMIVQNLVFLHVHQIHGHTHKI